jgi:predicted RNase H-like HicB family nuclease
VPPAVPSWKRKSEVLMTSPLVPCSNPIGPPRLIVRKLLEVNKNPPRILPFKVSSMKLGVTVHREGKWYVATEAITGVTSQGKSFDEALKNFEEAFELWFECAEEWEKDLALKGEPIATMVLDIKV